MTNTSGKLSPQTLSSKWEINDEDKDWQLELKADTTCSTDRNHEV